MVDVIQFSVIHGIHPAANVYRAMVFSLVDELDDEK
jgi:hypothetical protein